MTAARDALASQRRNATYGQHQNLHPTILKRCITLLFDLSHPACCLCIPECLHVCKHVCAQTTTALLGAAHPYTTPGLATKTWHCMCRSDMQAQSSYTPAPSPRKSHHWTPPPSLVITLLVLITVALIAEAIIFRRQQVMAWLLRTKEWLYSVKQPTRRTAVDETELAPLAGGPQRS